MKLHEFQPTSHTLFQKMVTAEYFLKINLQETLLFLGLWKMTSVLKLKS